MVMSDENLQVFCQDENKTSLKIYCPRNLPQIGISRYTYKALKGMTNDFARVIGSGAFAIFYSGCFKDGNLVQIKLYNQKESFARTEKFWKELQVLAQLRHKNIIPMIGYCVDGKHYATMFNEMPEGNLSTKLRGENSAEILSWKLRLKIALGAAKGLEYLHTRCVPPVIHTDVQSKLILLDHKLEAKLSGFELSTLSNGLEDAVIKGTTGYIDPEYFRTGRASIMTDVFNFGKVLLELIAGRNPFCCEYLFDVLVQWVPERAEGKIENIVDAKLQGEFDASSVRNILNVAIQCTLPAGVDRPTITDVIAQLERSYKVEAARLRKQKKALLR